MCINRLGAFPFRNGLCSQLYLLRSGQIYFWIMFDNIHPEKSAGAAIKNKLNVKRVFCFC